MFTAVAMSTPCSFIMSARPTRSSAAGDQAAALVEPVRSPSCGSSPLLGDADGRLLADVVVAVGDQQRLIETHSCARSRLPRSAPRSY